MKAIRKTSGLLNITIPDPDNPGKDMRLPGAPRYKEFCAGIGWLDPTGQSDYSKHAVVVVAEQEDGKYSIFSEAQGDLATIVRVAIQAKDVLLIERMFLDTSNDAAMRFLRDPVTADGLVDYETAEPKNGRPVYVRQASYWSDFRSRDTVAALIPVHETLVTNPVIAYDTFRALAGKGQLFVGEECTKTGVVLKGSPPLDDILRHPVFKAAAFTVAMMERTKERGEDKDHKGTAETWYRNIR
jgi:hypothetical protein